MSCQLWVTPLLGKRRTILYFSFLSHTITGGDSKNLSEVAAQQTGLCSYERNTHLCDTPRAELDANKTDFFLSQLHQKALQIWSLEKNMFHLRNTTMKRPYSKQNNCFIYCTKPGINRVYLMADMQQAQSWKWSLVMPIHHFFFFLWFNGGFPKTPKHTFTPVKPQ